MPKTSLEIEINAQNKTRGAFSAVRSDADRAFGKGAGGMAAIGLGASAAIAGVGAAVLAVGSQLVSASQTAAKFETAMARVGALSGATGKDFDKLTLAAKNLGASTTFTATEAAEGMQALAMAGFDVSETIAAMPAVLNAAAAAQTDLGVTADLVSNIMSGFGIKAAETGRIADVLTATFTSSNTTLESLGETMKFVGPIAKSQGQSLEDMAAAAGLLGSAGLQGSLAGTSLRGSLLRLSAPTEKVKGNLKDLNIELRDSNGQMLPLPELLSRVQRGMADLDPSEQTKLLKELVGTEALSGFQVLLDAGPEKIRAYSDELSNSLGRAAAIAKQQTDTLEGSYKQLGSRWESLQIQIGEQLNPAIKSLVDGALIPSIEVLGELTKGTGHTIEETDGYIETLGKLVVKQSPALRLWQALNVATDESADTTKEATKEGDLFTTSSLNIVAAIEKQKTETKEAAEATKKDLLKNYKDTTAHIKGDFVPATERATVEVKNFKGELVDFPSPKPDMSGIEHFVTKAGMVLTDPQIGLNAAILNVFDATTNGGLKQGLTAAAIAMGNLIAGPLGGAIAGAVTRGITSGSSKRAAQGLVGVAFEGGRLDLIDREALKKEFESGGAGRVKKLADQIDRDFPNASKQEKAALLTAFIAMADGKYNQQIKGTEVEAVANKALENELVKRALQDANRASAISGFDDYIKGLAFGDGGNGAPGIIDTPDVAISTPTVPTPEPPPPPTPAPSMSPAARYFRNNGKTLSKSQLRQLGWDAVGAGIGELHAAGGADLRNIGLQLKTLIKGYTSQYPTQADAENSLAANGYDIVAAKGFQGVVNKPTTILAGEAGPESIDITPLNGTATGGRKGTQVVNNFTINVSTPDAGSMARWVERDLFPMIQKQMIRAGRAGEGLIPQGAVMAA